MSDVPKIPLADRLRKAAGEQESYPQLFRLYADTYFSNLDGIFGGTSYLNTLNVLLSGSLKDRGERLTLAGLVLVADSEKLSDMERSQLLFQVLIRPFAQFQEEKERRENECLSLPS